MAQAPHQKIVAVRITGSENAVRAFLSRHPAETATQKREGDQIAVEIFIPEPLVEQIDQKQLQVQVLYDASARGRERQKEVGKGNRFEGDQRIPTGLGTKTREPPR